ncbi:hypothetical protein FPRO05_03209 [Fusarium proliferatum]|uniref:C2H2-type domain-containing protein n=1 Tax=Gibberella intermedia TaxID=948311 RepID=A0A365N0T2_GIBIN|nr:hypothetical protein FPRO05_03209 [Fusarium proliferatum]
MIPIQPSQCFISAPVLPNDDVVWDNTAPFPNSSPAQPVAFCQDDFYDVQLGSSIPTLRSDEWEAYLNSLAHLRPSASSGSLPANALQEVSSKENSGLGVIGGSPISFIYRGTKGPGRTHNMLQDIIQEAEARPEAGTTLFNGSESNPVLQLSHHSHIQGLNSESLGFQGRHESNQEHLDIGVPETLHSLSTTCRIGYMNETLLAPGDDLVAHHKHSNIAEPTHEDSHQVSLVQHVTDSPGSENHVEAVEDKTSRNTETLAYNSQNQCWDHGCNGRQFSNKGNLVRHQREKLEKDPICCPHCYKTMSRKRSLPGHIRRKHPHMGIRSQFSSTT